MVEAVATTRSRTVEGFAVLSFSSIASLIDARANRFAAASPMNSESEMKAETRPEKSIM